MKFIITARIFFTFISSFRSSNEFHMFIISIFELFIKDNCNGLQHPCFLLNKLSYFNAIVIATSILHTLRFCNQFSMCEKSKIIFHVDCHLFGACISATPPGKPVDVGPAVTQTKDNFHVTAIVLVLLAVIILAFLILFWFFFVHRRRNNKRKGN